MEEGALICKTEKRAARHSDGRLRDSIAGIDRAYTPYEHSSGSHESLQGLAVANNLIELHMGIQNICMANMSSHSARRSSAT